MTDPLAEIEVVRKVSLDPGDILVVRAHGRISAADADRIREQVRRSFDWHAVVVIDGSVDLEVVTPAAARA